MNTHPYQSMPRTRGYHFRRKVVSAVFTLTNKQCPNTWVVVHSPRHDAKGWGQTTKQPDGMWFGSTETSEACERSSH